MWGAPTLAVLALLLLHAIIITPEPPPALTGPVERLEIDKSERRLLVYQDGKIVRSYDMALGFAPQGDKREEGDGRTPEGLFRIDRRNAQSRFHLSLGIDYPRAEDRARAARTDRDPGGDIFIHGQPNGTPDAMKLAGDWTAGCIALSNAQIEELWPHTPIGTVVEIRP